MEMLVIYEDSEIPYKLYKTLTLKLLSSNNEVYVTRLSTANVLAFINLT